MTATTKQEREGWLDRILGNTNRKAAEVREELKEAANKLDELGVERKAADPGEVAHAITARILETAGGDMSSLTEENIKSLIEDGLKPASTDKAEEEEGEDEEPADADEDEVDEEMKTIVKELTGFIDSTVEDMGVIAKAQLELVDRLTKSEEERQADRARLAQLEKIVNARPRQASQADETVVKDMEDAETIKKEIEAGINGTKEVLGIAVND
ncbi:MAG TPA: hypothetical protein VKN76_00385 [Kiloniellaceae bacterium]|nr:hypothetical protein [Kiloniellaceae bacterium]